MFSNIVIYIGNNLFMTGYLNNIFLKLQNILLNVQKGTSAGRHQLKPLCFLKYLLLPVHECNISPSLICFNIKYFINLLYIIKIQINYSSFMLIAQTALLLNIHHDNMPSTDFHTYNGIHIFKPGYGIIKIPAC